MVFPPPRTARQPRRAATLSPLKALSTAAGMGLMLLAVAGAPLTAKAADAASAANAQTRRAYAIGPGPLGDVLAQFAAAAGVPLSFDPALVAGQRSPGLSGNYSVREGFARVLGGSGYAVTEQGEGAYSLRKLPTGEGGAATVLPTITVAGAGMAPSALPPEFAGGQVARGARMGLLGNRDVMDTPFNVTSYTSQWLDNRQSVTLADALNAEPSVRFTGQIGGVTDSFYIRGFPIGEGNLGEIAFDGVYGVAPNYHVFTDYIERVEVLKGPAALLYGMSPNSGVGGVINMVPKRSLPEDLTRLSADYVGDSQFGGRVDLSRRFGNEGEWGVRVNGMHRQGDTPLDNLYSRTDIGALSLDYQGERLRASLDLLTQHEKVDAPTRPFLVAAGIDVPRAADGRRNATQPWGWWKSDGQSALLRVEYDVSDRLTVFADAGGSDTDVSRLSDQTPTIVNSAGDTLVTPNNFRFKVERSTYNAGLRAKLDTGPVRHAISFMGSLYSDRNSQASVFGTPLSSNIYHPITRPEQHIPAPANVPKVSSSDLSGLALADTMSILDERAQLTLGVRQQRIESRNFNATTGVRTVSYDESATTPLAGLVIKPWSHVSLYANYIEGLSKGDVAPATASNAGQVFKPYKARQKEVGVKVELDNALLTLAAFEITKPSGQLTNGVYGADSEQRNRGLELSLSGEPLRGVRLLGGVTVLNAELTRTNNAATLGNRPVGVPKFSANLGAEWDLPWVAGLTLTGGMVHTGREYVNQANTQSVPSWTTFDLGARYAMRVQGKDVTLRANVVNLTNRAYWSGVASYGTISQGVPRTLMLSASMDF
ncbi:TonB-dependent receptor [Achromobacter piechaudii]|uniref:Ferrichrome receptor FcuA n=1 Tax=Achromobacter piechaudii TaxID=72556 RepID=A0ABM8L3R2_9BURK|nr:TonB-dependent receptor [Achromobacter piechaudii]CAB3732845.1 Ferrichrome receptor FcuA [Achromobacter piechaudii]CAB3954977.1 Ferrichrome receptor FcuA [Achromobacter piechaudii]